RAVAAQRLPSFSLGVDWIVTGDAAAEDVQGSGRDAVIVGAGLSVPLWQRSYADEARAAELEAAARRDDRRALAHRVRAALTGTLARLRDARRRAVLHEGTLAPQAEAALDSVLGAFTVGRAAVADVLLAERDLLEIRLGRGAARADHARAWARLEELVARPVAGRAGAEEPEGR
ncbi:MAG: TolC family protein, partial [Myxococcota bacterium]